MLPLVLLASLVPAAFGQDVNVQIVSVTSPVSPGLQADLVVKTDPGAVCTPAVSGPATLTLNRRRANDHGLVRWRARVPVHAASGTYQLTVTCATHDRQGSAEGSIIVH
jgi:hypothetical protein